MQNVKRWMWILLQPNLDESFDLFLGAKSLETTIFYNDSQHNILPYKTRPIKSLWSQYINGKRP
jgi:hypothetical protein